MTSEAKLTLALTVVVIFTGLLLVYGLRVEAWWALPALAQVR